MSFKVVVCDECGQRFGGVGPVIVSGGGVMCGPCAYKHRGVAYRKPPRAPYEAPKAVSVVGGLARLAELVNLAEQREAWKVLRWARSFPPKSFGRNQRA